MSQIPYIQFFLLPASILFWLPMAKENYLFAQFMNCLRACKHLLFICVEHGHCWIKHIQISIYLSPLRFWHLCHILPSNVMIPYESDSLVTVVIVLQWLCVIKPHPKTSASLQPVFSPNRPILPFHNLLCKWQPNSDSALACILSSIKPFKQVRQICSRKSLPLVPDQDFRI